MSPTWSRGTRSNNNTISVLKRAFEFGYRDRPVHENLLRIFGALDFGRPSSFLDTGAPLPTPLGRHRELELDGRQESAVGRQTTRPQHRDHAARLCGVGRRDRGPEVPASMLSYQTATLSRLADRCPIRPRRSVLPQRLLSRVLVTARARRQLAWLCRRTAPLNEAHAPSQPR